MGFNLLGAVAGAAQGAIMGGNPLTIGAGALTGAFGGTGASNVGGVANTGQDLLNGGYLAATQGLEAQQLMFQLQLQAQSQQFDEMTSERSELMRQQNTLRDVAMQQRKADNEITKEFIRSIG
jgi:hypothetical protein